jgi:hypothetical protein
MASRAGLHQANMAAGHQHMVDFTKGTASALANLATAISMDHQTVACLTNTIEALTIQLAEFDAWNKSRDKEFNRLIGNKAETPNVAVTGHNNQLS